MKKLALLCKTQQMGLLYERELQSVFGEALLREAEREDLDRVLEFTAVHAFLLGLRTGAGLEALTPR